MERTTPIQFAIALVATMALVHDFRGADLPKSTDAYVLTGSMASPLANQAAAVDDARILPKSKVSKAESN
jgi:hypothetical protein